MGQSRLKLTFLLTALACAGVSAEQAGTPPARDNVVGQYQGSAMELAAALDLRADGRFDYWLTYGALDETSSGHWRREGDRILLTSDPFKPPRIALVGREASSARVQVRLEAPEGFSRQYFAAVVTFASGERRPMHLSDEGLSFAIDPADPPESLRLVLPIAMLESEPVSLGGAKGWRIAFRFEPNELGKVDLSNSPLTLEDGVLILERHDRRVRFRPLK